MNKKISELRMLIINIILLISFLSYALFQLYNGNKIGMIGGLCMTFIAFVLCFFRYKMVIYKDMMVIYEWKIAAMLPSLIMYEDIKTIEIKSKYHMIIEHKYKSHIYVLNTKKFMETYECMKNNK